MKTEKLYREKHQTHDLARATVLNDIEGFCIPHRKHKGEEDKLRVTQSEVAALLERMQKDAEVMSDSEKRRQVCGDDSIEITGIASLADAAPG
jgi:hypothetical protein